MIPAQWKDCLKVGLAEAQPKVVKETGCFHITPHSAHVLFLLLEPVALVHLSQESSTGSPPHIVVCQGGKHWQFFESAVVFCKRSYRSLSRHLTTSCLHWIHLQRTGQCSQKCTQCSWHFFTCTESGLTLQTHITYLTHTQTNK